MSQPVKGKPIYDIAAIGSINDLTECMKKENIKNLSAPVLKKAKALAKLINENIDTFIATREKQSIGGKLGAARKAAKAEEIV